MSRYGSIELLHYGTLHTYNQNNIHNIYIPEWNTRLFLRHIFHIIYDSPRLQHLRVKRLFFLDLEEAMIKATVLFL